MEEWLRSEWEKFRLLDFGHFIERKPLQNAGFPPVIQRLNEVAEYAAEHPQTLRERRAR